MSICSILHTVKFQIESATLFEFGIKDDNVTMSVSSPHCKLNSYYGKAHEKGWGKVFWYGKNHTRPFF